ncbi:hypothetical protein QBC43DRAFT_330111 [Cladorrhinum sp. PSN259]|nr:hypothetical protein QBC43DRAFT_330111 [Cladorrhinum sp. PSN259]
MPVMGATKVERAFGSDPDRINNHPRIFKKHKVLPHPRKDATSVNDLQRPGSGRSTETDAPSLRSATSQQSKRPRRRVRGPEPPPTPPTHSRTSSATHPAEIRPDPNGAASPAESTETVDSQQPVTPPNHQTPPTPNLTPERSPPAPAPRQVKPRPPISERLPSKLTIGSRTESWKTAPENPESSDDDNDNDEKSTSRPVLSSAKTSQSTVRQINGDAKGKQPQVVGLGLGLESPAQEDVPTPTEKEFKKFDGEWPEGEVGLISDVEEEWDQNLGRNVMVRKKRRPITQRNGNKQEVVEDSTVTPTMATKALRPISLQESPMVYPRRVASDRLPARTAPSASEASIGSDMKRSSIVSTKSTTSTVVEAALAGSTPQRRKTLRHVRKQSLLRDSCSDLSPASSAPTSVSATLEDQRRGRSTGSRLGDRARESQASTTTINSISSRKARKEVWKTGGIPVVIVPERRSSVKSNSRPPSLRSTSSRRSQSVSSAHRSQGPIFERNRRRSHSESDGSRPGDERTIDFPPVIPARSSSLSATTSRNGSRTGSLTADSLRAHNAFQAQQAHQALQKASRDLDRLVSQQAGNGQREDGQPGMTHRRPTVVITGRVERDAPELAAQHAPVNGWRHESDHEHGSHHEDQGERVNSALDPYGDPFWGKRLSAQNTPFSFTSVDTAGTSHAEVSEAMAVNIYPHQSKSIVLVDHAAKPSESASFKNFYRSSDSSPPTIKIVDANGGVPSTPPQQFSGEDDIVDSPLRNPRAPPAPPKLPAINFIPATPSGYTPIAEKQHMMGNYFEMAGGDKPKRSMSLLKQTLTRRRTSDREYGPSASRPLGFLTRTFSLSRATSSSRAPPRLKRSSSTDDRPADETRLHPRWKPAHVDYCSDSSSCSSDDEDDDYYRGRTYKYPPIDNRPSSRYYTTTTSRPKRSRSLSERLKRTFAILPQQSSIHRDYYDDEGPERRTIRRTPSGNLRVMKFRRSMESLRRIELVDNGPVPAQRPITAPEGQSRAGRFFERKLPGGLVRSLSLGRSKTLPSGSTYGYGGGNVDDRPTFGDRINISRRLSERRREKRSQELRSMISGPKEVRDGVGEVIKRRSWGHRSNYGEAPAGRNVVGRR